MECFETDLMFGCQFADEDGAKYCEITLTDCKPKGDCSMGAPARLLPWGGVAHVYSTSDPDSEPFAVAIDFALASMLTAEPDFVTLEAAFDVLAAGGAPAASLDASVEVGDGGSVRLHRWLASESGRRLLSASRLSDGTMQVQEMLPAPPASTRLIGWAFTPSGVRAMIATPSETDLSAWRVEARVLHSIRRRPIANFTGDGVGTLPRGSAFPKGDDVGTLPRTFSKGDTVGSLPKSPTPLPPTPNGGDDVGSLPRKASDKCGDEHP